MTNPIVLGGVSGLVISLIGWQPPEAIAKSFEMLGSASVPAALLAFGLSLTGVAVFKKGEPAPATSPSQVCSSWS